MLTCLTCGSPAEREVLSLLRTILSALMDANSSIETLNQQLNTVQALLQRLPELRGHFYLAGFEIEILISKVLEAAHFTLGTRYDKAGNKQEASKAFAAAREARAATNRHVASAVAQPVETESKPLAAPEHIQGPQDQMGGGSGMGGGTGLADPMYPTAGPARESNDPRFAVALLYADGSYDTQEGGYYEAQSGRYWSPEDLEG